MKRKVLAPSAHTNFCRWNIGTAGGKVATRSFAGRQGLMPRGWNKTRDRWLRDNPLCAVCGAPAVILDHIIPRAEGGPDTASNYQSLCQRDSDTKTAAEGHRAKARKSAALRARFDTSDRHPSEY